MPQYIVTVRGHDQRFASPPIKAVNAEAACSKAFDEELVPAPSERPAGAPISPPNVEVYSLAIGPEGDVEPEYTTER